jgi:hypothetical protein
VQDRLAGVISATDGIPVLGPEVRWIGRRYGRRKDRRWAAAWSSEQVTNRLRIDFRHGLAAVAMPGVKARSSLVALSAQEHCGLGLQCGLQQQLRPDA